MWRLAPLIVLCTACDTIFGLHDVSLPPPIDAPSTLGEHLVAHYTLDAITGMTAFDSAGTHDGTCFQEGCPTVGLGHAALENALVFNGDPPALTSPEYLVVLAAQDLELTPVYTVALWIRVDRAGEGCMIQQTYGTALDNAWQLCMNPMGYLEFFSAEDGMPDELLHTGDNTHVGEWQHVAIVHTQASKLIYRNGVELTRKDTGLASFTPNAATYIGADIDNGSTVMDPFVGAIDEVRIYSRALQPKELVELATGDP